MIQPSILCVLVCVIGTVLACQPPDCDRQDCGTCGNACCALQVQFGHSASFINGAIADLLESGGKHGRYRLIKDVDYHDLDLPNGVKYMIQGIHITLVKHYEDILNFWIASRGPDQSSVRAFSISGIAGAYCDEGQNYKNLIELIKELGFHGQFKEETVFGCPRKL